MINAKFALPSSVFTVLIEFILFIHDIFDLESPDYFKPQFKRQRALLLC